MVADQVQSFVAQIQEKIQNVLNDFSEGKLNKDQFNVVYARYNGQLKLIEDAVSSGLTDPVEAAKDGQQTAVIMQERGGKFLGLRIFNNRNSMVIHTMGEFDEPMSRVLPVVENLIMMIESHQPLGRHLEKLDEKRWMLFSSGRYTISASIFKNEPSQKQTQEVYRLHRDFEEANKVFLQSGSFDANQLVYPFMVLVSNKSSLLK